MISRVPRSASGLPISSRLKSSPPHRHRAGAMRSDDIAAIDDLFDSLARILTLRASGDQSEIRHLDLERVGYRPVTPPGDAMTAGTEARVQLRAGHCNIVLRRRLRGDCE